MITRSDLAEAVRKLRGHFGETQQQFAARLNSAIITVARWETTRPPSGPWLEQLLAVARSEGLTECINLFEQAQAGNIEPPDPGVANVVFENERERAFAMALITVLRNPERYRDVTKSIEPALRKVLDEYKSDLEAAGVHVPMALAIVRLCNKGQGPEQISESLEMNVMTVERVLTLNRFDLLPKPKRAQAVASRTKPAGTPRRRRSHTHPEKELRKVSAKSKSAPLKEPSKRKRPRNLSDILEGYLRQESKE